jgi:hypothetical protein
MKHIGIEDGPQRRSCGTGAPGIGAETQWGPAELNISTLRHECLELVYCRVVEM